MTETTSVGEASFWFLRMKQGEDGTDFTAELWNDGRVGVMFGNWSINDILASDRQSIDESKLTVEHLAAVAAAPIGFEDSWLSPVRKFFREISPGDLVVVCFDDALHIGTVGDGYLPDSCPVDIEFGERVKCRPVKSQKRFALADLPSSYRLVSATGRGTVQRITAFAKHVALLHRFDTPEQIRESIRAMSASAFVDMLSASEWEVVCAEYLRQKIGFRSLLLRVGGTLKAVDIVGVDRSLRRVVAQCKNDSVPWSEKRVRDWLSGSATEKIDRVFFCCRGGVTGQLDPEDCEVIDGSMIVAWLDADPTYLEALKTM